MESRLTTKDQQTFCLYCQKEFQSPEALARHITKKHKGTYADERVVVREKERKE